MTTAETFSIIISILAFIASIFAIWLSRKSQNEVMYSTSIYKQYNIFDKLSDMVGQHWEFTHLLALHDRYDNEVSLIKQAIGTLTDEKRAEFLVREKMVALLIFQNYEQTLYQWQNSKGIIDNQRTKFLYDVLMYFTQRLLRNPRLLYYWKEGNLKEYFEKLTTDHYSKYVTDSSDNLDSSGPFGEDT
ncbi:hypothetical protein GMMP13_1500003 [Candidatus Magnetomoraceae bacterium gMMP-13]